jgi:CRISPR-associated endonuclease/helicase Cas3
MSELENQFEEFFKTVFKDREGSPQKPFYYQQELALNDSLPSLVNAPTGAGKTNAVLGAWLWRRLGNPQSVGRRLVYCLPMRTLVEQTRDIAEKAIERLKQTFPQRFKDLKVYVQMGGDVHNDWEHHPEQECILIGTQDMLLSRALNRGYALSRFKWPVHFGLLNNDCLWVFDEIQLMGSGLAASTQLEAFRRMLGSFGNTQTIWMSATVKQDWLATVDIDTEQDFRGEPPFDIAREESPALRAVMFAEKIVHETKLKAGEFEKTAKKVLATHQRESRTLIVVNTVKRAIGLHRALKEVLAGKKPAPELVLIHSRFRPPDRKEVISRLLADPTGEGTIIVSTQVVEAGVDVTARTLFTELAPWPSLVQRFGRCNRRGTDEDATLYWIDVKSSDVQPYDEEDLKLARERLKDLEGNQAGPERLREYLETLDAKVRDKLLRYEHIYVIRQHDLHGLFSTEPDLAGGYTDVSMFVRNIERESDVYVYWRDFKDEPASNEPPPSRIELCSVRWLDLKSFLGKKGVAWQWNTEGGKGKGQWEPRRAEDIRPGMTLLLATRQGGYHKDFGWTGSASDKPLAWIDPQNIKPQESLADELPSLIEHGWWSVENHLRDTRAEAVDLIKQIQFDGELWKTCGQSVILAAWWHDVGKTLEPWWRAAEKQIEELKTKAREFLTAHPDGDAAELVKSFLLQLEAHSVTETLWAKFPSLDEALKRSGLSAKTCKWLKKEIDVRFLPGVRHEAASALAAWQEWQNKVTGWNALAVYLVICHHGKVRTVLRSTRSGDDVFGIKPEATLPALAEWLASERLLDLRPKAFGAVGEWDEAQNQFSLMMPSWVGMVAELLGPELTDDPDPISAVPESEPRNLGPFRLAFLESLIRAADVRASRLPGKGGSND